ncbi:MAG: RdgB/HAM1 family non-canonical purine NTP pyrophosphatase [Spirochaetota bacterium]
MAQSAFFRRTLLQIVIASSNSHKIREIRQKFSSNPDISFIPMNDKCPPMEIEETGDTFEENALIKAREVSAVCSAPVLADDSGLEIDALNGEPGIYSARYGNLPDDASRNDCILSKMEKIPDGKRTARFVCVMALCLPDGREFTAAGTCEGSIIREKRGAEGFGYDPIFLVKGDTRTMAELSPEEKNAVSHRALALDNIGFILSSLSHKESSNEK